MQHILKDFYVGVVVLLMFGASIFIHELGHFLVALWRGLKIEAFAIGFGPKIIGRTINGIEYSWRWIPAGGYVKLPQMVTSAAIEGGSEGEEKIPPASPFSKILVAIAGPVMNVLFAFAIATLIYYIGLPVQVNPPVVGYVETGSPEAKAGVRAGDLIVEMNNKPVTSWQDVNVMTMVALTNVFDVTLKRGTETYTCHLTADPNNLLGLKMLNLNPRDHPLATAISSGSAAEAAGLKVNDVFLEFAGAPITSIQQFINMVQKRAGLPTVMVVKRGADRVTVTITPKLDPVTKVGRIGVGMNSENPVYTIEHPTPWSQISNVFDQMTSTLSALLHSSKSGVKASDLSGPVGIISGLAAQVDTDFRLALSFLVLLNINLGIINMFPIPVLDGGHILMAIIEKVRRRPLSLQFVDYTTTAFAVMLISFMLYVTFFDIRRLPLIKLMFNQDVKIEQAEKPAPVAAPDMPDNTIKEEKPAPAQAAPAH